MVGKRSPLGSSHPNSERICWDLASWVVWDNKLAVSVSRRRSFLWNDLPYSASNSVRSNKSGVFLSQVRASGNSLGQGRWVPWANLDKCLLSRPLAHSTLPEDWGLQEHWKWYLIPKALEKASPLLLWRVQKNQNLGIISLIRTLITSQPFSEE
jgi:hypothetical protein